MYKVKGAFIRFYESVFCIAITDTCDCIRGFMRKIKIKILVIMLVVANFLSNYSGVIRVSAEEEKQEIQGLYALSAVLLDGDSGRVLYEKDGYEIRAMASTTKIMTCIIALEYGNLTDIVTVSRYAASMPDVQLNIKEGEQYILEDLLYSLMLESHNDSAVAIAEHIAGSVQEFARLMNEKAKELGCNDTYFITPNGLDATEEVDGEIKAHSTTARDLAVIMKYCIKNEEFLKITRKASYTFANKVANENNEYVNGDRIYTVTNKNAFLNMMDGVISGKTGFTSAAGYCYVCAFENDGRTYIVALLGCGWPNNKTYKWSDTKKLLEYGMEKYHKKDFFVYDMQLPEITVNNGVSGNYNDFGTNGINADKEVTIMPYIKEESLEILCCDGEEIIPKINMCSQLEAPVKEGQVVGNVKYMMGEQVYKTYEIYAGKTIEQKDYTWSFGCIFMKFILH